MSNIIKTCWYTPGPKGAWGLNLIFTGGSSTAKTAIIEQTAEVCTMPLHTIMPVLMEPTDILGMSYFSDTGTQSMPPAWAYKFSKLARGTVFFDEFATAPPTVQNALLRVFLDRYVGDIHLPHVRFMGAMNRPEEMAGGGYSLPHQLVNRLVLVPWETADHESWEDWMMGGKGALADLAEIDPDVEEARVLAAWPAAHAQAVGTVLGFLRKAPHMRQVEPKLDTPAASQPWPSRRSWELVTRVLAGAAIHGLDEIETHALVAGCVGTGVAAEFLAYLEDSDMPVPADLLDGKVSWIPDARVDRTMAVLAGCTALVVADKAAARIASYVKLLTKVADTKADLVITHVGIMTSAQLTLGKDSDALLLKLGPVMQTAGLLR
jgi:hypothetical protein